jgi:uncharacterized protein YggE
MRHVAVAALCILAAPPAWAAGSITVSGTGEAAAAPDMATLMLGVTTEGPEAAEAMRRNAEAMAAVLAELAAQGVAERDVQTTSLSLSPRWEPPRPNETEPRVSGFVATNLVTVVMRDIGAVGGVLDAVMAEGANSLNGLSFGLSDDAAIRDAARRSAVADAAAKAQVLAEAAGVTLGPVTEIVEGGGFGGPFPQARMDMAMAEAVPVAPGEVSLQVNVTMTWAIAE